MPSFPLLHTRVSHWYFSSYYFKEITLITLLLCQRVRIVPKAIKTKESLRAHWNNYCSKRGYSNSLRSKPYPTNKYKCEQCNESFPLLAAKYRHRQKYHPAIAIINHSSHEDEKSDETPIPSDQNIITPITIKPPIAVIDTDPKPMKRRISDTDSEISFNTSTSPSKINPRNDLHPSKRVKYNADFEYSADDEEGDDEEEEDEEENMNWSGGKSLKQTEKYKSMYQKYRRDSDLWKKRLQNLEAEYQRLSDDKEMIIISLQKNIVSLDNEKQDYRKKIKILQKHIAEFNTDKSNFNSISKTIFNCVSIGEINKLRKVFKEKKYDELLKDESIKVIQKIFGGLVAGVIPVCNPQRTAMSKEERSMVNKIEESSIKDAKRLLRKNKEMVGQLFGTIDSSIKMIVDLYYQFGSKDEDDQFDSDFEDQSDDENQSYDEYEGEDDQSGSESQDVDDEDTDRDSSED